jgi:hypothetical protein
LTGGALEAPPAFSEERAFASGIYSRFFFASRLHARLVGDALAHDQRQVFANRRAYCCDRFPDTLLHVIVEVSSELLRVSEK